MARHTSFRYQLDPTVEQSVVLTRHAGASRFAFNHALAVVKTALTHRKTDPGRRVPWTGFDLINEFNSWKKSEDAGRVVVVGSDGVAEVAEAGRAGIRVGDNGTARSVTLPGIGAIKVRADTRRLRRMIARSGRGSCLPRSRLGRGGGGSA